jgi:MFS family permease
MAILACFPFWILLNHVNASSSFATIGIVSVLAGLASGVTGPIIKATLQNVTFPQSRGQAFALFNTFDDFGRGLGPVFVSVLISRLGGRTPAFNVGVIGWMVCGLFNLSVFFTVERDERIVQATLASSLSKDQADTSDQSSPSADAVGDRDESIATAKRRTII